MSSLSTHHTYSGKQKSLGLLCTNFLSFNILESVGVLARKAKNQYTWKGFSAIHVALQELKVFQFEMISLDEAAKLLLGNANNRTKVRRLYDIANVLSSVNLIEKTHTTNTRKPAFRWLGVRGKTWSESAQTNVKESQKRMFGSDITNINFKRKVDLSMDGQNFKTQNQLENISPRAQLEKKSLKKDAKQTSMSYQFGPFAPAYVHKVGTSENNSVKQVQDWESLAQEHRPQYQNQG